MLETPLIGRAPIHTRDACRPGARLDDRHEGTSMRLMAALRPGPARQAGLSLMELVVTAAIMGALSAIAIPIFLNQRASSEESTLTANLRTGTSQLNLRLLDAEVYGWEPSITATSGGLLVDLGKGGRFAGGAQSIVVPMQPDITVLDARLDPSGWCVAVSYDTLFGIARKDHQIEITDTAPAPTCLLAPAP